MINQMNKKGKYIVFDVDETLGYFSQLGSFIDAISFYNKDFSGSAYERFNEIIDLFPEFVRPKMIEILKYIHEKKVSGTCSGLFIYTNNQGPRSWVQHIAKYFDYKVGNVERNYRNDNNDTLFDKIIAAYMINGKIVEPGRTSQNKTYDDLLRITGISNQAEVCFVDDLNHPDMRHENVLYLNVKPYVKTLSTDEMIRRYLKSPLASSVMNTKDFTAAVGERMGSVRNANNGHNRCLNLHDANYISLNTPFDNASAREDAEFKASGDKLFNYIKMFLKTKAHSKRGTKAHSLHSSSQTRRHHRPTVLLSTHQTHQTRKHNRKRLHSRTRRIGKFMRI
jgi:hypothetical protein